MLHDVATELRLPAHGRRELVTPGRVEERLPADDPDLMVAALEERVDTPFAPRGHDVLRIVQDVAQGEDDLRVRTIAMEKLERGEQLAVDPSRHVVDDQHVRVV